MKQRAKKHISQIHKRGKAIIKSFTPKRMFLVFSILLGSMQLTLLTSNAISSNKPIIGVRVEEKVVGRLLGDDFHSRIDTIVNEYENNELTVKAADITSTITLRQLGVSVDKKQVYKQVLSIGRTGNPLTRFIDQNAAVLGGRSVSLESTNFNVDLAKAYLVSLEQKIAITPSNASFIYDHQTISIHSDTLGRVIDIETAVETLRQSNPLRHSEVILPIKQTEAAVTSSLLSPLLPQAQAIAGTPLKIIAGGNEVTLSPTQLVELTVPKAVQDPQDAHKNTAQLTFDEAKLGATVNELLQKVVVAPQPTIMDGAQLVRQGKEGVRAADSNILAPVLSALTQRQTGAGMVEEVHIPLVPIAPPVLQQAANLPQRRTGTGLVRLTFDDGPGAYTEQILDILKQYNVHATFYVLGSKVRGYPGTMQRIANEGHKIGNHSFSHADLTQLSRDRIMQELASTQAAIQAACRITPTAFRPPYGAENQTVCEVAASLGMSVDLWSVDPRDWAQPGSGVITQRALAGTSPGAVILLHVLHQQTVTALPSIIQGVRAQGFTLE